MSLARVLCLLLVAVPGRAAENPFAKPGGPGEGAAPPKPPFVVEIVSAPQAVPAGAEAELRAVLRVPLHHYVYAERTQLELLPAPGLEILGVQSPASETKLDPFTKEKTAVYERDAEFVGRVRVLSPATLRAVMSWQGCSPRMCFFPQSDTLVVQIAVTPGAAAATPGAQPPGSAEPAGPAGTAGEAHGKFQAAASRGLVWLLLLAFGAGVAASFTPCIYPMIPITIGIIGARSVGRRSKGFTLSLLYVLGIALVYSALGTTAALTHSLFGGLLQNPWIVGGVALVFVLMALSMFGAFEMQAPASLAGRMNRVQGSGYPGAFLLGLVAGVVASPCIAPVLGAMIAYVATSGSPFLGFALFFTFALGLGVLFIVLGTFTGLLAGLPKSGSWMAAVKIGFGLLFLGVALYYLHPLLPHGRGLWPVAAALLGLGVLLGGLRPIAEIEPAARRWSKALARVALVGGVYGAAVPFLPQTPRASAGGPAWLASEAAGRERARAESKPMLIDFSAEWCGACKELERYTFADPRVREALRHFVPVRIDATRRSPEIDRLMQSYGIVGLPWVAFVAPDGKILPDLTVTGFIDARAMLGRMARALPEGAIQSATLP